MENQKTAWLVPVLLAIGAGGALWYYWMQADEPVREPQTLRQPVAEPPLESPLESPAPLHPMPEPVAETEERPELVPLPPLDQSDDYFKLALTDIFGDSIESMLASSGMIERIVATVDNLTRPQVAERVRPLGRLGGQFVVDGQDDGDDFSINSSNYGRYDVLVALIADADLAELAGLYRRFYPLFQTSYEDLGYPDGYFNDRLIEVIDHLLATPDIDDQTMLVRPHVLYEFADPDLQSRSSGQKLLMRMGSEHRSRIKLTLRDFRDIATRL